MKMLISGKWVDAADKAVIEVTNPYDGSYLDTVPSATRQDVDTAIADAVSAQKNGIASSSVNAPRSFAVSWNS